jgi:hypothetical protein
MSVYADGDLFVFINGTLVLDLGGIHQQLPGKVTITGNPGDAQSIEGGCLDDAGNIIGITAGSSACSSASTSSVPVASSPDDFRVRTVPLGLQTGKLYEMAIFAANRHPSTQSNLHVSLTGSSSRRSTCVPTCGDGVLVAGEDCDSGPANNDNAYGGCTTRCTLGPRCGDSIVQPVDGEVCDFGHLNGTGLNCDANCKAIHL